MTRPTLDSLIDHILCFSGALPGKTEEVYKTLSTPIQSQKGEGINLGVCPSPKSSYNLDMTNVTKRPGTYLLLLRLGEDREIEIGRLGSLLFLRGYYLYVGSARGPGGLQARLTSHCRRAKPPRWHIDHLRGHANLIEIWAVESDERLECLWAQQLAQLTPARPIPHFGSSDCRCPSHLFHFREKPSHRQFAHSSPQTNLPADLECLSVWRNSSIISPGCSVVLNTGDYQMPGSRR